MTAMSIGNSLPSWRRPVLSMRLSSSGQATASAADGGVKPGTRSDTWRPTNAAAAWPNIAAPARLADAIRPLARSVRMPSAAWSTMSAVRCAVSASAASAASRRASARDMATAPASKALLTTASSTASQTARARQSASASVIDTPTATTSGYSFNAL